MKINKIMEISGEKNGNLLLLKGVTHQESYLAIDSEIRIGFHKYNSGDAELCYFVGGRKGPLDPCCRFEKIEPFSFKEGIIQSIGTVYDNTGVKFLTAGGVTYSIPTSSYATGGGMNSADKVFNKSEIINEIERLFHYDDYFCYEEKKATEVDINNLRLLSSKIKPGLVSMNGISVKSKTLNGENAFILSKDLYYKDFCIEMDQAEWKRIKSRRTFIAQMMFEHPNTGSYKIQYFKKGMIGVRIPDGSLIMKDEHGRYHDDEIMTPSGKIYFFSSWGSGCHSGYSVNFKHYASEEEKALYFEKGHPVKGVTIMDKAFGVTNNTPNTID